MKKTGDFVRINGHNYYLGDRLGGGLEGNVFKIASVEGLTRDFSDHVIKIVDDSKMNPFEREKALKHLKRLKSFRDDKECNLRSHVILPAYLLDDELGYIMKFANQHESLNKYIEFPVEGFDEWYRKYSFKKRIQIIVDIFEALKDIHHEGLIFADLSPSNIMVDKTKNSIVFIDSDNMRDKYDNYSNVLGTPGYMAPEKLKPVAKSVSGNGYEKDGRISVDSDIFSAAIIAFELLMLQHPFVGDVVDEGTADDYEAAKNCETDFIFKKGTSNASTRGLTHFYDQLVTKEIQDLFYRTFVDGKNNPSLRPTDVEFCEAFHKASNLIIKCSKCGFEQIAVDGNDRCCDCDKPFGSRLVFEIYNTFGQMDMADAINNMGDFVDLDVDISNILIDGQKPAQKIKINRVVFDISYMAEKLKEDAAFTIKKYLYLFDFENTLERSKPYAKIELKDLDGNIEITVDPKYFPNAQLINLATKQYVPLNNGKAFKSDKYGVIFESKPFGKGTLIISGKFVRE